MVFCSSPAWNGLVSINGWGCFDFVSDIACSVCFPQAIEEGQACKIDEDDIREASDVLMEENRKAWPRMLQYFCKYSGGLGCLGQI